MPIDAALLRTFLTVARAGSITAGARRLNRSQPAVTAALQRLEEAFGEPLLRREARGVRLTRAGERLLPHAEAQERVAAGVAELVRENTALRTGELRIAASTTIALYWLPPRLAAFHDAHPGVKLTVHTRNSSEAAAELAAGDVDVALVESPASTWAHLRAALLTATPVHRDELVVITSRDHPLAERSAVTPIELDGLAFVGREAGSGTRAVLDRVLERAGARPDVRIELGDPEAIKRAVAAGLGAAVLSRIAVEDDAARGVLAVVPCPDPGLRRDFTLLHPPDALASRAARAFAAMATGAEEGRARGGGPP